MLSKARQDVAKPNAFLPFILTVPSVLCTAFGIPDLLTLFRSYNGSAKANPLKPDYVHIGNNSLALQRSAMFIAGVKFLAFCSSGAECGFGRANRSKPI